MVWQDMAQAPMNGLMVKLKLSDPLETDRLLGWVPPQVIHWVLGWWDGSGWVCCFMDEGMADTEGHSSSYYMPVRPDGWAPMEKP